MSSENKIGLEEYTAEYFQLTTELRNYNNEHVLSNKKCFLEESKKLLEFAQELFFVELQSEDDKDDLFQSLTKIYLYAKNKPNGTLLNQINEYINDHISEGISLTCIASVLYHSPNYFSKLFKHLTGIGFHSYVEQKRMERARILLISTHMKIEDIASAVGYESQKYFSKVFKNKFKVTSAEFRKLYLRERPGKDKGTVLFV